MKVVIPKGATSRILTVFIQDSSSSTGAGLGSLVHTSSIVGGYVREGGTGVALAIDEDVATEGTYQAPSAAGKVRIGTVANQRTGVYELHFHNDLFATGAETLTITLGGASNMAELPIEVQLSDPVRGLGGPTALPNAAAEAAGGLYTRGSGAGQINQANNGEIDVDVSRVNGTGQTAGDLAALIVIVDGIVDDIKTATVTDAAGANIAVDIISVKSTVDNTENGVGIIVADTNELQVKLVGITLLSEWLGLIAGKQAGDATALAEIKASGAGSGTYDPTTDSTEALRDSLATSAAVAALNDLSSADVIAALEDAGLVLVTTTIDTLISQTEFALVAGASTGAYDGCVMVIEDAGSAVQKAVGIIDTYIVGVAKQIVLEADPGVFTMAPTDKVRILPARWSDIVAVLADTNELQADDVPALIAAVQADLPSSITKNVELAAFPFLLVDSTDHVTPKTGRTVTATRSIDGAAFGACANAVTEVSSGWYKITLAASDLNGDTIALRFTATATDDRNITIVTQPT